MNNVDELLAIISLCDDSELETITSSCERLLNERKTARNTLRRELMANLQQAIGAILGNGFELTITNWDRNHSDGSDEVCFCPDDHYSIEIE